MASSGDASKGHAMSSTQARGSIRCMVDGWSVVAKTRVPVQAMVGDNSSLQKMSLVVSSTSEMRRLKIKSANISPGLAPFR